MSGHIFRSVNPYTQQLLRSFELHTPSQVNSIISRSADAFNSYKSSPYSDRALKVHQLGQILQTRKEELANIISSEMGKTIGQSRGEIQKCADCCFYYAENGEKMLQPKSYDVAGGKCYVVYQPLGPILLVQPYNFPFWLPFKSCVPHLMAGNTVILKHAHNVPQCANLIEEITTEAGLQDEFLNLFIEPADISSVIADPRIAGVSLTGSERAGSAVASVAGKHLKKCVLELGGSDPYIVLEDADLKNAVNQLIVGRLQVQGQVCISPKRVFVMESMHEQFLDLLVRELESWVPGDPLNESTKLGPLAKPEAVSSLQAQIDKSVSMGARLLKGGRVIEGNLYPPTVVTHITPDMPVFKEEVFGPVFTIIKVKDVNEAVKLANQSIFGLGASIMTSDSAKAEGEIVPRIDSGMIFVNDVSKSIVSVPFGGMKCSGIGRELGDLGIKEFVNAKTVFIKNAESKL